VRHTLTTLLRAPTDTITGDVHSTPGGTRTQRGQVRTKTPQDRSIQRSRWVVIAGRDRQHVNECAIAAAVSHTDNLEFLSDVIPKTTTYKQFKEKKAKDAAGQTAMEKGQRTLNGAGAAPPANGMGTENATPQGEESKTTSPSVPRPMVPVSALIADRTVEPKSSHDHDVEMQG
jgi:DNA-directed RNA polymerase I subunit RPA43